MWKQINCQIGFSEFLEHVPGRGHVVIWNTLSYLIKRKNKYVTVTPIGFFIVLSLWYYSNVVTVIVFILASLQSLKENFFLTKKSGKLKQMSNFFLTKFNLQSLTSCVTYGVFNTHTHMLNFQNNLVSNFLIWKLFFKHVRLCVCMCVLTSH